jgi:catechol 2,3-dioxygenase-like lactoylglutathione lyase family enzyme
MRISLNSVLVDDQDKALTFYCEVLGFEVKNDIPLGDARWLTVVSPDSPHGTELLLEPNTNPAATAYQAALFAQEIPFTAFEVDDIRAQHERLVALGVRFLSEPMQVGTTFIASFDDTCGNYIQIYETGTE